MIRIVRLAILESYGVEWSLETFARDVLQNFFDAAPSYEDVQILRDEAAGTIEVRGPAEFDLDLLAFVGATTKNDGMTTGGFGEGFKICALVGVRDFGLAIRAGSADAEIEVFFDPVPLGRELCYRAGAPATAPPGRRGSFVHLAGCSPAVFHAFDVARLAFFHEGHPFVGERIAVSDDGLCAIHRSTLEGTGGEIYYRRQRRGGITYAAWRGKAARLTLVCHKPDDALEGDRDRRDLDPYTVAAVIGRALSPEGLYQAMLAMPAHWRDGHAVLRGFLDVAAERELVFAWPDGWIARGADKGLTVMAERQGFRVALAAFAALGMRTASDVLHGGLETRAPSPLEQARIDVCLDLYATLNGADPPDKAYEVFDSRRAAVLGQHLGEKVIVASKLLRKETFAAGASTVIHELCHEAGGEAAPAFLNRLGRLLGAMFQNEAELVRVRRVYERAPPKRPAKAKALERYAPEFSGGPYGEEAAVACRFFVPPGFPPSELIVERIRRVANERGTTVTINGMPLFSDADAKQVRAAGVPSVWIGWAEVDAKGAGARHSLRVRTYGPERSVVPSEEMIRAAFDKVKKGRRPRDVGSEQAPDPEAARKERNAWLGVEFGGWEPEDGPEAGLAWTWGCRAAARLHLAALEADPEPDQATLRQRVLREVNEAVVIARALRAAEAGFEEGDAFEDEAMSAAEGAFVAGHAASGRERGEGDFRAVRDATAELLALDLSTQLRSAVLLWSMGRAGLAGDYRTWSPMNAAAFREAFAFAKGEGERYQHRVDQEETTVSIPTLCALLERGHRTPAEALKLVTDREAYARAIHKITTTSHAIKATWEVTLAATGSEELAAEACLRVTKRRIGKL